MSVRVMNNRAPFSMEEKRFYLPAIVTANCPACGQEISRDFSEDPHYLSYPTANSPFSVSIHCPDCAELPDEVDYTAHVNVVPEVTLRRTKAGEIT